MVAMGKQRRRKQWAAESDRRLNRQKRPPETTPEKKLQHATRADIDAYEASLASRAGNDDLTANRSVACVPAISRPHGKSMSPACSRPC